MNQIFRATWGLLPSLIAVAVMAPACGMGPKKSGGGASPAAAVPPAPAAAPAQASNATATSTARATPAAPAGPQVFPFTAKYTERPVDLVIIRDSASHQEPINTQINAAILTLAARLWNLPNVHVGVFDNWYAPPPPAVPGATPTPVPSPAPPPALTSATPIEDATSMTSTSTSVATSTLTGPILDATALSANEFGTALEARVAAAGNRPGGAYLPAATLMDILTESQKPSGGLVAGLLRPGAYWSVVYLSASLNPDDPYDVSDVMKAFQAQTGNFMVSALAVEDGGTIVAGPPLLTINQAKTPERLLEIKLQQATQGVFASVSAQTYSIFADDVVNSATGTGFFTVTLPGAVDPKTIKIAANGVDVPTFRYTAGSTSLEVSTLVANGEAFTVTAALLVPVAATTVGAATNVDNVPQAGGTPASPAELAFLQNVQPSLVKVCSPCHSGNSPQTFSTDKGYTSALVSKAEIARRTVLPVSDPDHMPKLIDLKGTDLTSYTAITTWATGP